MSKEYEKKVREQFPNLQYEEFKIIENRQERLIIDDLSFKKPSLRQNFAEIVKLFQSACRGTVYCCSAEELAEFLNRRLEALLNSQDFSDSILIFPGNGAKPVKALLSPPIVNSFPSLDLEIRRNLSPDMSVERIDILTDTNIVQKILSPKLSSCLLVDDVIASGSTALTIQSMASKMVECDWYASVWMSLSPLQAKGRKKEDPYKSSLPGFKKTFASIIYQGISGIPANNSLSSFVEDGEKAKALIARYREKYAEDVQNFDRAILEFRRLSHE